MAGTVLTSIINEIETRHGIRIAELRVTMDRSHSLNGWPAANCVMVREDEVDAAHETDSKCEDRPLTHADRGSHELGATDGPAD